MSRVCKELDKIARRRADQLQQLRKSYQCTMDTLSLSMMLQQQPEADADALLRFPADSES
jgi:hypothetical protein